MGCSNAGITGAIGINCDVSSIGGLKTILIANLSDVKAHLTEVDGEITDSTIAQDKVVKLGFNNKDGKTTFTENKTVSDTGIVKNEVTVTIEFPRMSEIIRNAVEKLTTPNAELAIFAESATGIKYALGLDFGMYGKTVNGASGTSKDEKNAFEVVLMGEETNLSRIITDTAWDKIINVLKP